MIVMIEMPWQLLINFLARRGIQSQRNQAEEVGEPDKRQAPAKSSKFRCDPATSQDVVTKTARLFGSDHSEKNGTTQRSKVCQAGHDERIQDDAARAKQSVNAVQTLCDTEQVTDPQDR